MPTTFDKLLGTPLLHKHKGSDISDLTTVLDPRYVLKSGDTMTDNLLLNDNVSLLVGTGSDLEIFHNGTDSYIQNNTGGIIIENDATDGDISFKVNDGGVDKTVMTVDGATGNLGIGTTAPAEKLSIIGNFRVDDSTTPTKGYRFKTSGSDLDLDASGKHLYISNFSGAGFTGTQYFYLKFSFDSPYANGFGNWIFQDAIFGNDYLSIRPDQTAITVNGSGGNVDFRVHGGTVDNMIKTVGSTNALGFYGATPVAQQTGVAVSAAGIHAALVNLGLITA